VQIFQVGETPHNYRERINEKMTPYRTPQEKSNPLLMMGLMKFLQNSLQRKILRRGGRNGLK
jgi:hypothetical protein